MDMSRLAETMVEITEGPRRIRADAAEDSIPARDMNSTMVPKSMRPVQSR